MPNLITIFLPHWSGLRQGPNKCQACPPVLVLAVLLQTSHSSRCHLHPHPGAIILSSSPPPYHSSPPPPPPSSLIVMFFFISDHLVIFNINVPHPATIPALEEPRVHAIVADNACSQTPMRRCLRTGVGTSICLVEENFPRDLSRGRMTCPRRGKNTMIYYFYGFAR